MAQTLGNTANEVSLPSGGSQLSGIGEAFKPDLQTGSGNFCVPITCPPAQNGLKPDLALGYSTGGGNGPFGLGFRLPLMTIAREVSSGVPNYLDDTKARFQFSDGGRLVDCGDGRYRPEFDTANWLIVRERSGWSVTTKDGTCYELGDISNARIEDNGRIFSWLLRRVKDPNGLEIHYRYSEEGAQRYLESVTYGPFEVRIDYEDRPDSFVSRRAGFDVKTARRARAIRVLSSREGERELRRYLLAYETPEPRRLSLLSRITLSAGHGDKTVSMPAVSLRYTALDFTPGDLEVYSTPGELSPPALEDPNVALVDLAGDGLPDVIATDDFGTIYWQNMGGPRFDRPRRIRSMPGSGGLGDSNLRFADVEGNGTADLLLGGLQSGFLPNSADLDWEEFVPYGRSLPFDLGDPNLRLVDVDGNGRKDAVYSTDNEFLIFSNLGRDGWDPDPIVVSRRHDLDRWPDVFFSNAAVYFADMTGDGLMDIVFIENGRLSYWPYYGFGEWGPRTMMRNSPALPPDFEYGRLFLIDLDGDGAADVVYLDASDLRIWINRDGESFSAEEMLDIGISLPDNGAFLTDMGARGRPGLLISYPGTTSNVRAYRYLPLGQRAAPFLLNEIDNGLGAVTCISYESAEHFRHNDRANGRDWKSFLPFPVQTVSAVRVSDRWTGVDAITRYFYREGYYDGEERAFRGFAAVEETEVGDAWAPGVLRRYRFSVGADLNLSEARRRRLSSGEKNRQRALTGAELSAEIYDLLPDGRPGLLRERTENEWQVATIEEQPERDVLARRNLEKRTETFDPDGPTRLLISRNLAFDNEGDLLDREVMGGALVGTNFSEELHLRETMSYAYSAANSHGFRRKALCESRRSSRDGELLELRRHYYDGDAFDGVELGRLETGNLTRTEILALNESSVRDQFPAADLPALGYRRSEVDGVQIWFIDAERFERNADGTVTAMMGPMGETTEITFDLLGIHPVRSVNAAGHSTAMQVDAAAETISVVRHPSGHRERRIFDSLGRVVGLTKLDDAGEEWLHRAIRYELASDTTPSRVVNIAMREPVPPGELNDILAKPLEEIRDAFVQVVFHAGTGEELQRRVSAESGETGELRTVVSGSRHRSRRGFVHSEDSPYFGHSFGYSTLPAPGQKTDFRFTRDWQGRIVRSERVGSSVRETSYSPWQTTAWDERSCASGMRTKRVERYDAWNRLVQLDEVGDTEGTRTTHYEFDFLGRLKKVIDAAGNTSITLEHDYAGRRYVTWQIDAGSRSSLMNAGGRVVEVISPDARMKMSYDVLNRLQELRHIEYSGSTLLRKYSYDSDPDAENVPFLTGRIARAKDEAGVITYRYNRIGQTTEKTRTLNDGRSFAGRTAYSFTGEISSLAFPNGREIEFTYNEAGMLDSIPGVIDHTKYSVDGRIEQQKFANGVVETYTYDEVSRLLDFVVMGGDGTSLLQLSYRNGAGLAIDGIESATTTVSGSVNFAYDGFNQLTSADNSEGVSIFEYDYAGNLTRSGPGGSIELLYEDAGHPNRVTRLRTAGNEQEVNYDDAGRISSLGLLSRISYDPFGRLIYAERDDGRKLVYEYGHEFERVRKQVSDQNGMRETVYFDEIFEDDGVVSQCHIVVGGSFVGTIRKNSDGLEDILIHHTDHLGSTRLITDTRGVAVVSPNHSPFGTPESSGDREAVFIGRSFDLDLGMHFLQMRFYDPSLGRFLTPDPAVLDSPQDFVFFPLSLNPYAYAINNPVRYRDPNGRFAVLAAIIVGAVVGGYLGYQTAKEQGKDPWAGALIGALVGGLLGYAGGFAALEAAAIGSLKGAAFSLISGETDSIWTSAAIGFAFGGIGYFAGQWTPVAGEGVWVDTANIAKEIAIDAGVMGLQGLAMAALTGGDLKSGFFEGALTGAIFSAAKIALFGVRYNPLAGKTGETPIDSQVRAEYARQTFHDKSHLASEIKSTAFPDLDRIQFRRHGLIPKIVAMVPGRGGSIVLGDNVQLAKGELYNVQTLAHELRHIHQQQLMTFGTTEFLVRYLFLQDHSQHYRPGNTTYEPYY